MAPRAEIVMRTSRIVLFTLAAVVLGSCTEATSIGEEAGPWDIGPIGPSLAVVEGVPAVCGTPTVTSLIADETVEVGTVSVMHDDLNVYVAYRTATAWPILKTALFVGSSAASIPANNRGNPRPGQFPYKSGHGDGLVGT